MNEYNHVDCKVFYEKDFFNNYNLKKITDLHHNINKCNNIKQYLNVFLDNIKDNIMRRFFNLNEVTINYCILDNQNIRHIFLITVFDIIKKNINDKTYIDITKSIIIEIKYQDKIYFEGCINFTYLI